MLDGEWNEIKTLSYNYCGEGRSRRDEVQSGERKKLQLIAKKKEGGEYQLPIGTTTSTSRAFHKFSHSRYLHVEQVESILGIPRYISISNLLPTLHARIKSPKHRNKINLQVNGYRFFFSNICPVQIRKLI